MNREFPYTNWFETHRELKDNVARMPTIREFVDFIALVRSGKAFDGKGNKVSQKKVDFILNEIFSPEHECEAEFLDARFHTDCSIETLFIDYSHRVNNMGDVKPGCSEPLDNAKYLKEDRKPGIDLEDWLLHSSIYGLPASRVKTGLINYGAPKISSFSSSQEGSVARFCKGSNQGSISLDCNIPSLSCDAWLGVRPVRIKY